MSLCEDYPCCGHTPSDPCSRQWYDEPGAFDVTKNPHALCNHEEGECDVDYDEDEDEDEDEACTHDGWESEGDGKVTCSWCDAPGVEFAIMGRLVTRF